MNENSDLLSKFADDLRYDAKIYRCMAALLHAKDAILTEVERIRDRVLSLLSQKTPEAEDQARAFLEEKLQQFAPAAEELVARSEKAEKF